MKDDKRTGIRYSDEFKLIAIQKIKNGASIQAVAKELGVNAKTLGRWIKESDSLFVAEEQSNNRYIQELKMKIAILVEEKKALMKLLLKQVSE